MDAKFWLIASFCMADLIKFSENFYCKILFSETVLAFLCSKRDSERFPRDSERFSILSNYTLMGSLRFFFPGTLDGVTQKNHHTKKSS